MKAKFYICEHCGNLVTTIHNAGVPLVCCGEKMKELLPNTVEASGETSAGGRAFRQHPHGHGGCGGAPHGGCAPHPVALCGDRKRRTAPLSYPGQAPKAVFELGGEKPVAVYAYCNLHGLWMTKL